MSKQPLFRKPAPPDSSQPNNIMKYTFTPTIKTVAQLKGIRSVKRIKNEPMLFGADMDFAIANGGPLTRDLLHELISSMEFARVLRDSAPEEYHIVIDTRSTMTMKGAYPSIPGWHCDDVPRGDQYEQPDLDKIDDLTQHFLVLMSSTESHTCTEFVPSTMTIDVDPENVWRSVNNAIAEQKPKTRFIQVGELVQFDQQAIHRATATANPGWRWFARVSITKRKPVNEIRDQVQVYMPLENVGW